MSIKSFIQKVCVQPMVYWEYTGIDGFHNPQFNAAEEINVRWDAKTEVMTTNDGEEFISNAEILTPQDLVEKSWVYLGNLADLPANPDPRNTEGAYEIKRMERTPLFKSTTFDVFQAYV